MPDVGYAAAFLGGVLALLSPCSAMLLPAFFAYSFGSPGRLLQRTGLFYLGLAASLVPLGMGSSMVGSLLTEHREALIVGAGVVLIGLGLVQVLGGGFAIPGLAALQGRVSGSSPGSVAALGAVYGLAGFCSGPILGAVLTVAAVSGSPVRGGVLLATYALGMAAPLFVLALLWDRLDLGRRRVLRGRTLSIGQIRLHTTSLVSGLLFIGLGILFLATDGTTALGLGVGVDTEYALQERAGALASGIPDLAVVALIALAALGMATAAMRRRRRRSAGAAASDSVPGGYESAHGYRSAQTREG